MWIGGFEPDGAPEEFNKQFERSLALSLHDREVLQLSARWSVPRLRAIATPVRKTTVHQLSLPTGRLAPPVIDLRLPRVRKELRGF